MHRYATPVSCCIAIILSAIAAPAHGNGKSRSLEPDALLRLAQRYDQGEGVAQDFARANELYCRAARAGNAEAQFRLGWIYASARGVRRDSGVAAALFAMAAEQGHPVAKRRLPHFARQPDTRLPACLLPLNVNAAARREIEILVQQIAPRYAIDPQLVMAVIAVESGFNARAVSPKNAQGLMQLVPETAARFGVKQVFDPRDNIQGGLAYLRWLMAFFQGDVKLVLAAYNAGERAVERYRGIPPFEETRAYVERITSMYRKRTHPYNPRLVEPSELLASSRAPGT
jgi:soluble lytic murein transglycosylase-like protein